MRPNTLRYHVGHNSLGCPPEYRVECIGNLGAARQWLDDDVANSAEDYEGEQAELFTEFLTGVDLTRESVDPRVGERHRIGDMEFWIIPVTACCCPCSCERGRACNEQMHNREAITTNDSSRWPVGTQVAQVLTRFPRTYPVATSSTGSEEAH